MLAIGTATLAAFDAQSDTRFIAQACRFLRKVAGADLAQLNDAELREFIIDSRRQASRFNVVSERGIIRWVVLRISAGADFASVPAVQTLFSNEASGERALAALWDQVMCLERLNG
jgi:hypothetical protein